MANIKISDLRSTGSDLFSDSESYTTGSDLFSDWESYMGELDDGELGTIKGGISPVVSALTPPVIETVSQVVTATVGDE